MAASNSDWWLVAFTGALVFVGVVQSVTLWRTNQTYRATQRPWVDLDAKITGPMEYSGKGPITMLLELGLKNSGHSPALDVRVLYKTLLVYDGDTAHKTQRELCKSLRASFKRGIWGSVIFPNAEPVVEYLLMEISREEIGKYVATGGPDKFTRPLIIGCIGYVSSFDRSYHHTGFKFLVRPIPAQKNFELPKQPIPASDFELVPYGSSQVD